MAEKIYLIEFNQDAESTLNLIHIDTLDSVAGARRQSLMNFGRDESGWRVIGWAKTQPEAHEQAEAFLHQYYSAHPDRFLTALGSTSNLAEDRKSGYDPQRQILPRQTYR